MNNDTEVWRKAIYIKTDGEVIKLGHKIEVSTNGNIRWAEGYTASSKPTPKILQRSGTTTHKHYMSYKHYTRRGHKYNGYEISIHRIVASTFLSQDWRKGLYVDHINRDHLDNRLSNLRWTTPKENSNNSDWAHNKKVVLIDPEGNEHELNEALTTFAENVGLDSPSSFQSAMSKIIRGYPSCYSYKGWTVRRLDE